MNANVSIMFSTDYIEAGIGVPRNFEVAKNWYLRAASTSSFFLKPVYYTSADSMGISALSIHHPENGSEQARNRLDEIARRKRATGRPTRQEAKAEGCVIA